MLIERIFYVLLFQVPGTVLLPRSKIELRPLREISPAQREKLVILHLARQY